MKHSEIEATHRRTQGLYTKDVHIHTGKCITSICWYLRVLPVLHRPEVVDIGVKSYIEKHVISLKDYRIRPFLSIRHAHGDLCKHLGIDSSTDLYSNLFLNAYINRHAHTEYLK